MLLFFYVGKPPNVSLRLIGEIWSPVIVFWRASALQYYFCVFAEFFFIIILLGNSSYIYL